jgi:hypothetical protein
VQESGGGQIEILRNSQEIVKWVAKKWGGLKEPLLFFALSVPVAALTILSVVVEN